MFDQNTYQLALSNFTYAFGRPELAGHLKRNPSDFIVTELMDLELSGSGEHFWLDLTKTRLSTERVAKFLARYAGVAYRDVGYAGMKDVQAVTRQWFSVWLPKNPTLDWNDFEMDGVQVHAIQKHNRKLKRGAHKGNHFSIRLVDLTGDPDSVVARTKKIEQYGVPNYFGAQRFGREARNLLKAESLFNNEIRIKDRNLKSIVLSSARSFLFNTVVSGRVADKNWGKLMHNEPAGLNGGNSIFASKQEVDNEQRLADLDIHPTAPMWGRGAVAATEDYTELARWEGNQMADLALLQGGIERNGLEYQRRAIRSVPISLSYSFEGDSVRFEFTLQSGQFATSILRELVSVVTD